MKIGIRILGLLGLCMAAATMMPGQAYANTAAEYQTSTTMLVRVDDMDTTLYEEPNAEAEVVGEAETGETYQILELVDEEWMKIDAGEVEGYLNTVKAAATVMETAEEVTVDPSVQMREEIVNYALQFVGNPYVYGGTNPNTGADCSGFTSYILRNVAGVELPHSSAGQANQGRAVSAEEMRPGDLICYSSGGRVNHVALYIGAAGTLHEVEVHAHAQAVGTSVQKVRALLEARRPCKDAQGVQQAGASRIVVAAFQDPARLLRRYSKVICMKDEIHLNRFPCKRHVPWVFLARSG